MDRADKKKTKPIEIEQPVPSRIYPVIDADLARDNLENDIPAAVIALCAMTAVWLIMQSKHEAVPLDVS